MLSFIVKEKNVMYFIGRKKNFLLLSSTDPDNNKLLGNESKIQKEIIRFQWRINGVTCQDEKEAVRRVTTATAKFVSLKMKYYKFIDLMNL